MHTYPPTIVLRHRKENLKKCSLRGLEEREDFLFLTYPYDPPPLLTHYLVLHIDAPPLTSEDSSLGLFLIDATWRYAEKMAKTLPLCTVRSLPSHFRTAYPRRQSDCPFPDQGLASIEALYLAYQILGRDATGLLDQYHWKESFLQKNSI